MLMVLPLGKPAGGVPDAQATYTLPFMQALPL
jgi:hypothetical protein